MYHRIQWIQWIHSDQFDATQLDPPKPFHEDQDEKDDKDLSTNMSFKPYLVLRGALSKAQY